MLEKVKTVIFMLYVFVLNHNFKILFKYIGAATRHIKGPPQTALIRTLGKALKSLRICPLAS